VQLIAAVACRRRAINRATPRQPNNSIREAQIPNAATPARIAGAHAMSTQGAALG